MTFWSIFERYNNKVTVFQKSQVILTKKLRTNQTADTYLKVFSTKSFLIVEKFWLFGLNSGDKGDNIDMWMIKITIKAIQIDMDVLPISKVGNIQKACLSLKSGFFHYFIGL